MARAEMPSVQRVSIAFFALVGVAASPNPIDRLKRQLLNYDGSGLQFNVVLTVPVKDPAYDVSMSFFLLGNYELPPFNSQAIYTEPLQMLNEGESVRRKRASRASIYRAVEGLLERVGRLPGRACLLRSICEAATWPVDHDGLLGQLVHTILTPSSTSENGPLSFDYLAAEELGRTGSICGQYFASCPSTPLDLMTTLATLSLSELYDNI